MKYPFIIFMIALLFCACRKEKAVYRTLNGNAQGTTFSIKYEDHLQRDFSVEVDSLFRLIDKSMSLWDSSSVISRLNRNEYHVRPDSHFLVVLHKARVISEATNGAFDFTVGPLVKSWGFSKKKGLPPPDSSSVDSLKKLIGYQKIKIVQDTIQKENPAMELDFNAIAQGYTVDLISQFLEARNIENYMVEIGGEVRASGVNERDSTWVIGIDKPVNEKTEERILQTQVALKNKSLATSGSYRKYVEREGKKYSHVIDPHSGYPVTHNLLSVSVIADDCTTADAYATAFMVMGMENVLTKASELSLEVFMIYQNSNGALETASTPGFGK